MAWFKQSKRTLPWRELDTRRIDPYEVLVSEFMLQQTQSSRVEPYYEAWLVKWPTVHALAAAPLGEVLTAWGRLGYPRRAKWLHEAAKRIVCEFNGEVPRDVQVLETFTGIGPYTARAVAVFAFGEHHPVIDTNVRRVLARWQRGEERPTAPLKSDYELLTQLLPKDNHTTRLLGYGIMELGATVCSARAPTCNACPVQATCQWRAAGYPAGPPPRTEARYEGSDRQVRGFALALLREAQAPLPAVAFANISTDAAQRERALASLVADGLITQTGDTYSL